VGLGGGRFLVLYSREAPTQPIERLRYQLFELGAPDASDAGADAGADASDDGPAEQSPDASADAPADGIGAEADAGGTPDDAESGCDCRLATGPRGPTGLLPTLLLAVMMVLTRRRRRSPR
jgi:MYXO-CTERM domain-containing protein